MNKEEFIGEFAAKASLTKVEARKEVEAFIKTIEKALEKGDKITIKGFGTFSVIEKSERTGINPMTKVQIRIPAHKVVKFKPGTTISRFVK
jgi:DNA-binding protein HU-beta